MDLSQRAAGATTIGDDGQVPLVGTNSKFLFLYSSHDREPLIVPLNDVARITPYSEMRKGREQRHTTYYKVSG